MNGSSGGQSPTLVSLNHQQTLNLAWTTLLTAFLIACVLLSSTGYLLWSYRTYAMTSQGGILFIRGATEWVKWQRKTHTTFEQAQDKQELKEGERLGIVSSAGYGQVATVRFFDQSTMDMWARADVVLEKLQTSRWNNHQQMIILQQNDGYVRYDVSNNQTFQEAIFRVRVGEIFVDFAHGGSYSIEFVPSARQVFLAGDYTIEKTNVDIAVRAGFAIIQQDHQPLIIKTGEHVVIEPLLNIGSPKPAMWELVRDGSFSQYSEQEYNNTTIKDQPTLPRAHSWQVFSGAESNDASGGFFRIYQGCEPPDEDSHCTPERRHLAAWFFRRNNQPRNFTTGVVQQLGARREGVDISEYRSLFFSIWIRILYQSVNLAGERGTECPVMIRFLTKQQNPTDPEEERVICVYTSQDPLQKPQQAPGIKYYRATQNQWMHLQIELRDPEWLPEARYLWSIAIFANGHDYDSRVTNVSLIGSHYGPVTSNEVEK